MKPPLSGCAAFPSLSTRFALGEGNDSLGAGAALPRRLLLRSRQVCVQRSDN